MRPRIPLVSHQIDIWLAHRELRQLKRAEGIPGIPRVLARPARNVYLREYIEGTALPRAPTPPVEFFDRLMEIAVALHERGITYNDLHKEANVIVRPDGSPGVLDFQLSLSLPKGSALFRILTLFDRYHVVKNRRHRTKSPLSPEEEEMFRRTKEIRGLHQRIIKKPMNLLTRRLFPKALGKLPTDTDP
jgi:RIO-like serine/threonine protein kinase